jgi:hypothetical protein
MKTRNLLLTNAKKIVLAIALSGGIVLSGFAQTSADNSTPPAFNSPKFDILLDYCPAGTFDGTEGIHINDGFGVTGKYEFPIARNLNLTLSDFEEEVETRIADQNYYGYNANYIFSVPKVGLKYFLEKSIYAEGEVGYENCSSTDFDSGVAFSIGAGFDFDPFELGARYESWGSNGLITQITFHLGFRF